MAPSLTSPPAHSILSECKLESKFLAGIELAKAAATAKEATEAEAARVAAIAAERAAMLANADRATAREHRLVHAWVLVRAGEREVKVDTFIECASGRTYPTDYSLYLGVEFAWNHANFWVNMQQPEPHSDARAHPVKMSFDFRDANKWEAVLGGAPVEAAAAAKSGRKVVAPTEEDSVLEADLRRSPSTMKRANSRQAMTGRLGSANSNAERPNTADSGFKG